MERPEPGEPGIPTWRQPKELRRTSHAWAFPLTIGILLILGGVFALFASYFTGIISVIYVGVMLLIVGVLEIVSAFRARHHGPWFVYSLAGILAIVTGFLFLARPLASLAALTLLLAAYLFASGLFRGIAAIADRYPRWGWDLAYGIVAVALGVYVIASYPLSVFWVIGTIVAAEIIARGITLVTASTALRHLARSHPGSGLRSSYA